jgi:carbon-monoxide dehydrogenase medium subunit
MSSTRHITTSFSYHCPETLDETLKLLRETDRVQILAGGTDLLIQMRTGEKTPDSVVEIMRVEELNGIDYDSGIRIGAAVQFHRLEDDTTLTEKYPALHDAIKSIAGVQIRNMATLAGNLCNASPIADTATPLMVLGALLEICWLDDSGKTCSRDIQVGDFFTGPGFTILEKGQLLTAVHIPDPPKNSGSSFIKVCRVALDLAKISCAVYIERDGDTIQTTRIAIGGAAPTPVAARAVEQELTGKMFSAERVEKAARLVESDISPITDVRSTEEFRRNVAAVIVSDAVFKAWRQSGGEGDHA